MLFRLIRDDQGQDLIEYVIPSSLSPQSLASPPSVQTSTAGTTSWRVGLALRRERSRKHRTRNVSKSQRGTTKTTEPVVAAAEHRIGRTSATA
jgi:hypothetical protein